MSLPPPNPAKPQKRSPKLRASAPNSLMSDLALPPNQSQQPSNDGSRTASEMISPMSQAPGDKPFDRNEKSEGGNGKAKDGEEEEEAPVEPGVLAEAINKLESLRTSAAPSRATSPIASGASSPHAPGVPTVAERIALERQPSQPGTPHFGAQTDLLKQLDESTKVLRKNSKAPVRAPSVSGIGNVVEKPDMSEAKIVVAMVGLPARGKSYLSNKLMRYLRWLEFNVEVFNVGQLRRSKAKDQFEAGKPKEDHSASYFSHSDQKASQVREKLAEESLESLISWLKKEGNVGIMDATNSTFDRRQWIRKRIAKEPTLQLLFLESYCDDPAIIATNVALKVQSGDPDYKDMTKAEAEADFRKRIAAYESVYDTISEPDLSFCRILNVGRQVTINKIQGYLQSRIAFYLMNLHLKPRNIYLSRHGESQYNVGGQIGGDSDLSPQGWQYAQALPALVKENVGEDANLEVWTSTLQRTMQTGSYLNFPKKTWKSLDELDAGVCDGMTYEEIEEKYPEDYESRDDDKFNYRYRGGESYRDVVVRLEPVIMELERQRDILIIGHQAVLRCLYAYFLALPQEELPYIKIPLHTLIKITPMAYGCHEERYPLPITAVDTHRPRPAKKTGAIATATDENRRWSAASTQRDYFGDTKMYAAKPESLSERLEGVKADDTLPTVVQGQNRA